MDALADPELEAPPAVLLDALEMDAPDEPELVAVLPLDPVEELAVEVEAVDAAELVPRPGGTAFPHAAVLQIPAAITSICRPVAMCIISPVSCPGRQPGHRDTATPLFLQELAEVGARLALTGAAPRGREPSREKATARLPEAEALLARALVVRKGARGGRFQPQADAIVAGLEAQVRALASIAQGQIVRGEEQAGRAQVASRAINELSAAFHRVNAGEPPVFDRASGVSRYDPHPVAQLEVTLPCPNRTCRKAALYGLSTRSPHHRFECTTCKQPFLGYFGEVRSVEQTTSARGLRNSLRLDEVGGRERTVSFEDASGGRLPVAPHDLVALLYTVSHVLVAVENLSTARVLWVQGRDTCFLATAALGTRAAELEVFRSFRDRALLPRPWGRAAVRTYYRVSPRLVPFVERSPGLRRALRWTLRRAAPVVNAWGR